MAGSHPLFGIHAQALELQRRRMELIAGNIANADTPGFKARDLDFRAALDAASGPAGGRPLAVGRTDDLHLALGGTPGAAAAAGEPAYRIATQPAADGNTVDVQVEQGQYAEAALRYQASLSFADSRIKSLITALTGQ